MQLSGNLTHTGTIAGRDAVILSANNIEHLGGRITANVVSLTSKNDLTILGASVQAQTQLEVSAGRDLPISSTTHSNQGTNTSHTSLDRIAGLYVTGDKGLLIATAGNNLNLNAAVVSNGGPSGSSGKAGQTQLSAVNNVNLGTLTTASSQSHQFNAKRSRL